ncbi:MAG: TldD/PmbA family protein [Proteobacteria bacterium]|nr:MAG: TldD/PmbA family protein [Pseudomonadota bacterium]
MDHSNGKDLCFQIVDMAKKAGIQECDVILNRGQSLSLQALKGSIDKSKVTSTQVVGIRVIQDQKIGISASESLETESLRMMVEQAKATSKYSGVDPYQSITQKNSDDIIVVPDRVKEADRTSLQEKIALAIELEQKILAKDKRIHNVPYSGYSDGEGESFYANHLGTFCYQKDRSFSAYTSALAGKDPHQAMYSSSTIGRTFAELDLEACVDEASEIALRLLDAKAIQTGRYDIIFSVDEWESILGAHLGAFSAKAAKEGTAFYRDKLSTSIAHSGLTMRDLPKYADGFSYSAFDDEGVPREDLTVIDHGVLKSFYHNSSTAKFFKTKTTAHAGRGARGSLGVSPSQLVFDTGSSSDKDMYTGQVLKVISLKGLHSGTNAVSGHFSLAIEGVLYKDGTPGQMVKDVTLSANFYVILKNIQAIGTKLEASAGRGFFSPSIRFSGLSVAGT